LGRRSAKGQSHPTSETDRSGTLKLTVPAHRPILRSTLAHILKQAQMTVDHLNDLL
jgi:hypothetical protein